MRSDTPTWSDEKKEQKLAIVIVAQFPLEKRRLKTTNLECQKLKSKYVETFEFSGWIVRIGSEVTNG